jgi:hypothetical protein
LHGGGRQADIAVAVAGDPPRNSKNCVARTFVNGTPPASISPSWWALARMYPLSVMRSAPTTERATWCPTPAVFSAASRLRVDLSKNSITASSAQEGEFDTSTTTFAPASASASPAPLTALTPEDGEAETASWPRSRRIGTSFLPMSPLPPITTIFMAHSARVTRSRPPTIGRA